VTTTAACDACGTIRPLHELLIIHDRHDSERPPWFCCRSSFADARGDCLLNASGSAADYSIALADPLPQHDVVPVVAEAPNVEGWR
jgi:hypothetical protein